MTLYYIDIFNIIGTKGPSKREGNLIHLRNGKWIKSGGLMIDVSSLENDFLETVRRRQEIWDYIEYRESLVKWPCINEKIKMGASLNQGN
jgi:hypothetical protein